MIGSDGSRSAARRAISAVIIDCSPPGSLVWIKGCGGWGGVSGRSVGFMGADWREVWEN